jgi:hypothetical protein
LWNSDHFNPSLSGESWGEGGYFRFKRGINLANMEGGSPTYPIMS